MQAPSPQPLNQNDLQARLDAMTTAYLGELKLRQEMEGKLYDICFGLVKYLGITDVDGIARSY